MIPNFDGKFHYGVVNANSLDPEVLSQLIDNGTSAYEADFEEEVEHIAKTLERFMDSSCIEAVVADIKNAFYENKSDDDSSITFEDVEGVYGMYSPNNNVVMIFKSPWITTCRECSICYPNAGDLDSYDAYGSCDTYTVPEDWWCDMQQIKPVTRAAPPEDTAC
jgi:hypothetical protein